MNDKLKRLLQPKEMHSVQVIAVVGLIMSAGAQVLMFFFGKQVPSFGYIYPTWAGIFLIGYLLNLSSKPHPDDHHHH